jgi:hypothetical protein
MPSFFEEVDGVRIHYEKVGTGPQVLLLIPGAIGKFDRRACLCFARCPASAFRAMLERAINLIVSNDN